MKAKFIEKNGSMGYRHGKIYDIVIYRTIGSSYFYVLAENSGLKPCPYSNMEMVRKNWSGL